MKDSTRMILNKELVDHKGQYVFYGDSGLYNLQRLFDIYSEYEITSMRDLCDDRRDFSHWICANIEQFIDLELADENILRSAVQRIMRSFYQFNTSYVSKSNIEGQQIFAKIVEKVIGENKSLPILDVGSGGVPYSSMLLGGDGYNVTAMDNIVLSPYGLQRDFGVKSIRAYFNSKTNIDEYGIIVGRKPCSAIVPIVESGVNKNMPYMVKLCGCEAPGEKNDGWKLILPNIDKDGVMLGDYFFNSKGLMGADGRKITNDDIGQVIYESGDSFEER